MNPKNSQDIRYIQQLSRDLYKWTETGEISETLAIDCLERELEILGLLPEPQPRTNLLFYVKPNQDNWQNFEDTVGTFIERQNLKRLDVN